MPTKIEWCDETINPIQDLRKGPSGRGYHCTHCSPGCDHCYAERINKIRGNGLPFDDSTVGFELIEKELRKPFGWKKHRAIFVQSMGDLFHEAVPDQFIAEVVRSISENQRHIFIILTKRPKRLYQWADETNARSDYLRTLDNLYLGLTIVNQQEADAKIPVFLQVPGKKFLSIEPMLEEINIENAIEDGHPTQEQIDGPCGLHYLRHGTPRIDAVILGGESGPGARPLHPDWVRKVRDDCAAAGVPFFLKHLDKKDGRILDGRTHDDLPWTKGNHG